MDMWLHTILNDPKVRGSEYMPVVYYSNMRGVPLLSYTYLAKRWGWSKSRVGRFMLKAGEYGIISRVSFSSSRGSVISMCRYREMIFGDTCEELELSSIGEIIGITKAADLVDPDEGKMDISIETRVPPAHTIGKPRKALRIQVFLVIRSSFFARQIPLATSTRTNTRESCFLHHLHLRPTQSSGNRAKPFARVLSSASEASWQFCKPSRCGISPPTMRSTWSCPVNKSAHISVSSPIRIALMISSAPCFLASCSFV